MKKINKLIAGVASAAMIVTAFSACGSASSSGKKLDFITGMATGSVHLKTLQSITDEFRLRPWQGNAGSVGLEREQHARGGP